MQAGWHPDPWRPTQWRYHDGSSWTDHAAAGGVSITDPVSGFPPPVRVTAHAPSGPARRPNGWLIAAGCVALVEGVVTALVFFLLLFFGGIFFMPWSIAMFAAGVGAVQSRKGGAIAALVLQLLAMWVLMAATGFTAATLVAVGLSAIVAALTGTGLVTASRG